MNIKETFILNSVKDLLVYQVQQLLKSNKIAIDKDELAFQIKSHPSYPSLHSITGVLDHFNIENLALDVPINEETLAQLPPSFLAQIETVNGKEFAVVKNQGLHYDLVINSKEKKTVTLSKFITMFTGILVAVEKDNELNDNNSFKSEFIKNSSIVLTIILATIPFILARPSLSSSLFMLLSVLGVYISTSIYKQELGEDSLLGNTFCSGETEAKNCDAVLSSKGAKLFKNFKLSDLSIIYFSGITIGTYSLILLKINLSTPLILSILALPITLYSIYYQYKIVEKWCLLCLSIVGVLWVQAIIASFNNNITLDFSFENVSIIALTLSVVFMTWNMVSPLLKIKKEHDETKVNYFKFKKNFNLFNTLLQKPKTIETAISNTSATVFGNTQSPLNITVITNPFCGHCRAVHTLVEDILKKYHDLVQVHIRFNINTTNPESDAVKITSRLLEFYHTKSKQSCLEAMHGIYSGETASNWLSTWGEGTNNSTYIDILKSESNWCKDNAINFTPEILINGKSFPKEYDRSDLIYFIEDLHENCCQNLNVSTSVV